MADPSNRDSEFIHYCPDINEWPYKWSYETDDIPFGKAILDIFKPFLLYLIGQNIGMRTIQKHINNINILGRELLSYLHKYEQLRTKAAYEILMSSIDGEGGPGSLHIDSETKQASFDSTCRMLYRYLKTLGSKSVHEREDAV